MQTVHSPSGLRMIHGELVRNGTVEDLIEFKTDSSSLEDVAMGEEIRLSLGGMALPMIVRAAGFYPTNEVGKVMVRSKKTW